MASENHNYTVDKMIQGVLRWNVFIYIFFLLLFKEKVDEKKLKK